MDNSLSSLPSKNSTEYTISNNTNYSMLFTLSDNSIHQVTRKIEERVSLSQVQSQLFEEIRFFDNESRSWGEVLSAPAPDSVLSYATISDALLPPDENTPWEQTINRSVINGSLFQFVYETRQSRKWTFAGPGNHPGSSAIHRSSFFSDSHNFTTEGFEVFNSEAELKIPIGEWYAIAPTESYTITKYAQTPSITPYDDIEVGETDSFFSYTPKRLDKKIEWHINNRIGLTLVHNLGFDNINEMASKHTVTATGTSTHVVSR